MTERETILEYLKLIYNFDAKVNNEENLKKGIFIIPAENTTISIFIKEFYKLAEELSKKEPDVASSFLGNITARIFPPSIMNAVTVKEHGNEVTEVINTSRMYDTSELKARACTYRWLWLLAFYLKENMLPELNYRPLEFPAIENLLNLPKLVQVYRGLCLEQAYGAKELSQAIYTKLRAGKQELFDVIEVINYKQIGTSWAFSVNGVSNYLIDSPYIDCYDSSLVVGLTSTVHETDVDWMTSIILPIWFPEESEIRIIKGTSMKIEAICQLDYGQFEFEEDQDWVFIKSGYSSLTLT